jgi:uncharacterized OsmC-like protein
MAAGHLAESMERVEAVLRRRPAVGLHDDAPAVARWEAGTRIVSDHRNGARIPTDMPVELGGTGDQVSPGWLFRAGIASCAATVIAMGAAAAGIELAVLEVSVSSRSDTRGLLGMRENDGSPVPAGTRDLKLHVRIAASGVAADRLRALVEEGLRRSPIYAALLGSVPMTVDMEVDAP